MSFRDLKLIDVGIIVYDEVDLLDITGPKEVFSAASIQGNPEDIDASDKFAGVYNRISLFNTKLISVYDQEFITTADGVKIIPDYKIADLKDEKTHFNPFIFVMPGGKGVHTIRKDKKFIEWLQTTVKNAHLSLSVCTGAYALAEAGLLDDQDLVTTHWRHYDLFAEEFPHLLLANNARYVDNGTNIITTGGVSSAIDGSLKVVSRLLSEEVAQRVADAIVYPWLG
ncbi:MAG: Isonitrile hydratase [Candidatus Heimdallarchaeota archaeon LC_2]|nr:MAG: Isonitrile hydratase [Candidatus Heimdallarchaeota archaeon LC_2]